MNTYGTVVPKVGRLRTTTTLSKAAKQRLKWLAFYESHGQNARLTCRHFGISPDVFYRWKRRYKPGYLVTLEDQTANRRPKTVRRPQTDPATVRRIKELREQYPRWGKKKLHALLRREGFPASEATVGRTLTRLRARGQLQEPPVVTARLAGKGRRSISKRPHAVRRDWSYVPKLPGDLVQVDTLHVTTYGQKRYQFTASDYISKHTARLAARRVTATSAARVIDTILDRLPVKPVAIQVDGGSEFMSVFERVCAQHGITLYVLPPHSPKLNGVVERMNRTSREEIYDLGLHELLGIEEHNQLLTEQDRIYNHVRPHEALGMRTPEEYYAGTKP
ncbi:MAG: integrase core domain-containing protein [Acidobacteriota bacterium]